MGASIKRAHVADNEFEGRIKRHLQGKSIVPFEVRLLNDAIYRFGDGNPTFTLVAKDHHGFAALMQFDELSFTEAYINGSLEIEGDMWNVISLREAMADIHPLHYLWRRIAPFLKGQLRTDKQAISDHYELDNEFFLEFLDRTRCYSQAVYTDDNEPLEDAQRRKLDFIIHACELKSGDRVLDVGGGWGTFVEYAGRQGIQVTALTLAHKSEDYLNDLIRDLQLPCEVKYGDFYQYSSPEPFDAIVILGVMEHLPNYRAVLKQISKLTKPGGKIYLDASSFRKKYSKPTFISRYVFPGNHRYFCLHDFLSQAARTNLEVREVFNDRHSYYLTCNEWAKRLDQARNKIVSQWGEKQYRIFRLYLWASSYAFYSRSLDAYRIVMERP